MNHVTSATVMRRPARWDQPFDPGMTEEIVDWIRKLVPFVAMDKTRFPPKTPLRGLLKNDCRLVKVQPGEVIMREGDYGNSAFLLVQGEATVALTGLPPEVLGRGEVKKKSLMGAIAQLWQNPTIAEVRSGTNESQSHQIAPQSRRVFVQDVPRLLQHGETAQLEVGELFGELAALTRTPRATTVIADTDCQLIEIRWQGLRDILKYDLAMRNHVDHLYRQHSLQIQLRNTELLDGLSEEAIQAISEATIFQSFGSFDWNHQFKKIQQNEDSAQKIHQEPVIVAEGEYVNGLLLIRNGFARVSQVHGDGHRTIAYLGKGQPFGFREVAHNWATGEQRPHSLSLRAVGYVDCLLIPTETVEKWVLPSINKAKLPPLLPTKDGEQSRERRKSKRNNDVETSLLEFLVEGRLINGTQAMLIDRDRCTRCDDCVQACANAHDGNPRFVRSGLAHDHWMVAQSCMHCMDPVCMIGCPTGAIARDENTGVININDNTCIGCGTCANSCPYQNIQMVPIRNKDQSPMVGEDNGLPILKATKCDLCMSQLGGPACQRACPHDALVRIDLTNSDVVNQFFDV